jgi:DNA polymerase-1
LNLGFLASICINVPAWKHTSKGYTKGIYNAADCANTRGLVPILLSEMERKDVMVTYERKMTEIEPSLFMQLRGVDVDIEVRDELIKRNQDRLELIEKGLKDILQQDINFRSPQQLQKLLYVDLELPVQFKRRKSKFEAKKPTTDAEALERLLRKTNNPILRLVLEHRKISKLLDTFLKIELTAHGKVHTSYNIVKSKEADPITGKDAKQGTVYGRWSSSKSIIYPSGSGNLQNIPRVARRMYVAPPGYEILQADYKQAEAVIVAHLINDVKAIQVFDDPGGDIHKLTASMMFNIPLDQITKDHRNIGKRLRHAGNYSAGPAVVAHALGVELKEAKQLIQLYHNSCPQLRLWHKEIQAQLTKNKTLVTPLGRKHVFTERWGDSLFRSAYSFIPQSTVGEMLNIALVKFYHEWGHLVDIWMQLHDAMYILKRLNEDRQLWMKRMRDCMLIPLTINHREVIIDVDFKVGKNWGPYCDKADPEKNVDLNLDGLREIEYEGA